MLQIIPSESRNLSDFGWLQARWPFSFGHYHDPSNTHWSTLRVFNDDIILGGGKFETHPHANMEIITYVISGALEHKDSVGNKGIIHPGEVQVMSAGTGIEHSEANASPTEPLRLLQLWLFPRTKGLKPRWEQKQFTPDQRAGKLLPVVSDGSIADSLQIDQDATIFVSELKPGQSVTYESKPGRHAYAFIITGAATLNGNELKSGDQARIEGETKMEFTANAATHLILLDLP